MGRQASSVTSPLALVWLRPKRIGGAYSVGWPIGFCPEEALDGKACDQGRQATFRDATAMSLAHRGCSRQREIVPSITFIATTSGVLMARGIPVFADAVPETCQIDPTYVERKITNRTRGTEV